MLRGWGSIVSGPLDGGGLWLLVFALRTNVSVSMGKVLPSGLTLTVGSSWFIWSVNLRLGALRMLWCKFPAPSLRHSRVLPSNRFMPSYYHFFNFSAGNGIPSPRTFNNLLHMRIFL